jgi:hypothetical protein
MLTVRDRPKNCGMMLEAASGTRGDNMGVRWGGEERDAKRSLRKHTEQRRGRRVSWLTSSRRSKDTTTSTMRTPPR